MAAADMNFKLADIALPELQIRPGEKGFDQLVNWLNELKQAIIARDNEIKKKLNQLHVEYVTTEPTAAPDDPEPVFQIYNNAGTYYLYAYMNSVWKKVALG